MNPLSPTPDNDHIKNMAVALVLCALLIIGFQYFVEAPKRQKLAEYQTQQIALKKAEDAARKEQIRSEAIAKQQESTTAMVNIPAPRIDITSDTLHGSLSLKGLRLDTLTLAQYKQTQTPDSPEVQLLYPSDAELPYFIQFGWLSDDPGLRIPDANSIWQTSASQLRPDAPLQLQWYNGEGVTFYVTITLDEHYMFSVDQQVFNQSGKQVSVKPYALINRAHQATSINYAISHEGPLGVIGDQLEELTYDTLHEDKQSYPNSRGWIGFTDKYWLTALIPDQDQSFTANFSSYLAKNQQRYQTDYVGPTTQLIDGERSRSQLHFFAGAKVVQLLDQYTAGVERMNLDPVPLFDRAVDFGWLYFLTKPIFQALEAFYHLAGNFGIAIILLTFTIKLFLFPVANKGYKSMTQLKKLQPEMTRLKSEYGDDRIKMQQELLKLYKKEGVNPASGCLPMLIQLPVFFALYKVLFVTIEMRHAHFWGPWQDLSAQDPTNLFTAFGLVPWDHPAFLSLGIFPILMALTMWIQMRQQPAPPDPVQAKVMKFMPWVLMIIVAHMPAGLVLYWVVSNTLSVIQQGVITGKYSKKTPGTKAETAGE